MLDANSSDFAPEAILILEEEDFSSKTHQNIFTALKTLFANGQLLEPLNVFYQMQEFKTDSEKTLSYLLELMAGATYRPMYLLEVLVSYSTRKRLVQLSDFINSQAEDASSETQDIIEITKRKLTDIENGKIGADHSLEIKDFLELPEEEADEELIEGIAFRSTRFLLVGEEGAGKSVLLRQIAALYSRNIHPFTFKPIEGGAALIIDLENPRSTIKATFQRLMVANSPYGNPDSRHPLHILEKPAGIDLRSRSSLTEIEAVIRNLQPKVVVIGPLYKMYEIKPNDNDAIIAQQLQNKLDYLRTKYNFALFIEHHAGNEDGSGTRKMRPFGSSYWRRWPEIGMGMTLDNDNPSAVNFECWRPPRFPMKWPEKLVRGNIFPFSMADPDKMLQINGKQKK